MESNIYISQIYTLYSELDVVNCYPANVENMVSS